MTCTLNKSHAANELVESVRARDTKRVDAALHQFECEQDPGPLKNAIKAAMALRGPKEERVEAILKKLAREAGEWQDRMNDCCIFEDVYEEAALSGTPPDRLIVFMSDAGYAADAGYYVNLLCLKNFGHVYAIELFSFLAQRSGCLKLANMSPDPNYPCYDDAVDHVHSIKDRSPGLSLYTCASEFLAEFQRAEIESLAALNYIDTDTMTYELTLRSLIAQTGIKPRNWDDAESFATRARLLIFKFVVKVAILLKRARERCYAPGGVGFANAMEDFYAVAMLQ